MILILFLYLLVVLISRSKFITAAKQAVNLRVFNSRGIYGSNDRMFSHRLAWCYRQDNHRLSRIITRRDCRLPHSAPSRQPAAQAIFLAAFSGGSVPVVFLRGRDNWRESGHGDGRGYAAEKPPGNLWPPVADAGPAHPDTSH